MPAFAVGASIAMQARSAMLGAQSNGLFCIVSARIAVLRFAGLVAQRVGFLLVHARLALLLALENRVHIASELGFEFGYLLRARRALLAAHRSDPIRRVR